MAFVSVVSPCGSCRTIFSYNPNFVPSTRDRNNVRQPICRSCMDRLNTMRRQNGLEPFPIHPEAYEPADEREVFWED